MHINILRYKNFRYLKLTIVLLVISIAIYLTQGEKQPANGGTWQGYSLGIFSTFIILILSYLGIRKRSYKSRLGYLEGWTSAHVYLGGLLLITALLHSAFQVGWNVHTLALCLMLIVIASGFYGIYTYIHYPSVLSDNNSNKNSEQRIDELLSIDDEIMTVSSSCSKEMKKVISSAIENTMFAKNLFQRLRRRDNSKVCIDLNSGKLIGNQHQNQIIEVIAATIPNSQKQSQAVALGELLELFSRRKRLIQILTREVQIKNYFKVWLMIHIPMTISLLAALIVHVLVVFIYW